MLHPESLPRQFDAALAPEAVKSAALEACAGVSASFSFSFVCFSMLLTSPAVSPLVLCLLKQ